MTEILIQSRPEKQGCLRFMIVALVVAGLLVLALWSLLGGSRREPHVTETAPPVAAPAAEPERKPEPAAPRVHPAEPRPERPAGRDAEGWRLLEQARAARTGDNLSAAREKAHQALETAERAHDTSLRKAAEELLGVIHITLLFAPHPMPEKTEYTVQSGDTIGGLARRFGTTQELIMKGNRLRGSLIRVGDRLRIFSGDFFLHTSKSDNDLVILLNDRFFKRYRVGTGRYGLTPTGRFEISDRIKHPAWWRQGRMIPYGTTNNVLGTHWLALRSLDDPTLTGYGIHGTWEPESIGLQASEGCIRLLNEDIEELYTLIPTGTPVLIEE